MIGVEIGAGMIEQRQRKGGLVKGDLVVVDQAKAVQSSEEAPAQGVSG